MSETPTVTAPVTPRLKQRYHDEIKAQIAEQLGIENVMRIPTLDKIVVNVGLGEAVNDAKALEGAIKDLTTITGQKPRVNRARKSIAGFKLREGMPIGVKVTLRGDRKWEFFDRLLSVALPRIRDFRGLKATAFDGNGNYTFGLIEQLVFPEIDYDDIDAVRGMDITIVTTAENDEQGRAFLDAYGFPFARPESN
ncbi:MAG: 50S ribosomal protein L5 [Nitriliruptoraceae bacterium]|nr:50S ribosomal protein L5 [Nitriliruptoraceae bacterium]